MTERKTPTEPAVRPYAAPVFSTTASVEVQLTELRMALLRQDRDVHDLSAARHRHAAGQARLEAHQVRLEGQVTQVRAELEEVRTEVRLTRQEVAEIRPDVLRLRKLLAWGGGSGLVLLALLEVLGLLRG